MNVIKPVIYHIQSVGTRDAIGPKNRF